MKKVHFVLYLSTFSFDRENKELYGKGHDFESWNGTWQVFHSWIRRLYPLQFRRYFYESWFICLVMFLVIVILFFLLQQSGELVNVNSVVVKLCMTIEVSSWRNSLGAASTIRNKTYSRRAMIASSLDLCEKIFQK